MQHGPGAKQAVGESSRDLEPVEHDAATPSRRHADLDRCLAAGRDARFGARARSRRHGLEVAARSTAWVRERDAEHGRLTGKRRFGAGRLDHQRLEVAVAGVHRDDAQRAEQERQHEAEVVRVVERAEQHRDQHQGEGEAESGRQDVDAAAPQRHRPVVGALSPAEPVAYPTAQGALRGIRRGVAGLSQGMGTDFRSAAATSAGPRSSATSRGRSRWPTTAGRTACRSSGSTPAWPCR